MNILVTAGNTQMPIDEVRCLTNIFSGRTGCRIALEALHRGHVITFFTSHPERIAELAGTASLPAERWKVATYRTFDDLSDLMLRTIPNGNFDAIIHTAAVGDYMLKAIHAVDDEGSRAIVPAGKIKGNYPELWLQLTPTPKLVDRIRRPWGFSGMLVKFKLEVGQNEADLALMAEASRLQSNADFIVANTLENMNDWALIGSAGASFEKVARGDLANRLLNLLEGRGGG